MKAKSKMSKKKTEHFDLDPESFRGEDYPSTNFNMFFGGSGCEMPVAGPVGVTGPTSFQEDIVKIQVESLKPMGPIISEEEESVIKNFYNDNPQLKQINQNGCTGMVREVFNDNEPWIQTYSGRRFSPTNPIVNAIVIQDIAHSLSMQCRFTGHVKKFYSVAQHSVLVSYLCNYEDALWGLLHDASEAYLVDVPSPLKRSGKFDSYLEFERNMQAAICKRFELSESEPVSVKKADKLLLATESRDLMSPLRSDWVQPCEPLPFKIDPLSQQDAKDLFMKRFFELTNSPGSYAHYLSYENRS
jgi:5'-deoxynucleotidase YfbR-like HD superfamily hydrolase